MFSKISRYKKQEAVVTTDAEGFSSVSKALRLLPETPGQFLHTVEEVDRLDHLAYKYYKQPRKWWRICDANPELMLPQALLGKDPMQTTHFTLAVDDEAPKPDWSPLLTALNETLGVETVQLKKEEVALLDRMQTVGLQQIVVKVPQYRHTLIIKHNSMNITAETLVGQITALSFLVGPPEPVGRVGKQIIIPPNLVG